MSLMCRVAFAGSALSIPCSGSKLLSFPRRHDVFSERLRRSRATFIVTARAEQSGARRARGLAFVGRMISGEDRAQLFRLAAPTYIAHLTEPIVALVDLFWIARISAHALAGAGIASAVFNTFAYVFTGLSLCGSALIANAQNSSRDAHVRRANVERAIVSTTAISLYVGIIVAVPLLLFAPSLISLMGAGASTYPHALAYLRARATGLPFLLMYFALCGVHRSFGNARTPLAAASLGAVVNVLLDPLLSFPPIGLGVFGAGLATAFSTALMTAYLWRSLLRTGKVHSSNVLRFSKHIPSQHAAAILKPLLPQSIKRVLESSTLAACCAVAARHGAPFAAAMEIAQQTWWTIGVLWWPLGVASSAIIAGLVAARSHVRARDIARYTLVIATVLGFCGGAVVYASAGVIPRLFVKERDFFAAALMAIRYLGIVLPFTAAVDVLDLILIAKGDANFVTAASLFGVGACGSVLLLNIPNVCALTRIWIALGVMAILQCVLLVARFVRLARAHNG